MQRKVIFTPTKTNRKLSQRPLIRTSKDTSFSFDEFKADIAVLRANANVKITEVAENPNLSGALHRVRNILQTMSGDSSYKELNIIIEASFNDLVNPVPYTVGAQFRGWSIKTNMDGTDFEPCVAVRIGSFQKPGYVSKCKYVTMYADWNNDKFTFTNDIVDRNIDKRPLNQVVINVPFTSVNTFPGFSAEEIEDLKRNDVTDVCILGFKIGSNDYIHLTRGEFIPLNNIKTRYQGNKLSKTETVELAKQLKEHYHHNDNNNNSSYSSAAFIFFIIIIVIIIVLFYLFWK